MIELFYLITILDGIFNVFQVMFAMPGVNHQSSI
jgi:hypothetical protein